MAILSFKIEIASQLDYEEVIDNFVDINSKKNSVINNNYFILFFIIINNYFEIQNKLVNIKLIWIL